MRLEFDGAIYHVVARGNGGQDIVHDDSDRGRLLDDLGRAAVRSGWEVLAFVLMNDHFHVLLKTPRANLARGMQGFLSSYAHWCLRRRGRPGHLFQGRYKADMIENETYYWAISRYMHLNPVRAELVEDPADWPWSSYQGYVWRRARLPWVAYETLLDARPDYEGAKDASSAYRRYVRAGVANPPPSPFTEAFGGWALGSKRYLRRLRTKAVASARRSAAELRHVSGLDADLVCAEVSEYYGVDPSVLSRRHDRDVTAVRAMAAWLCRRYTESTLRELALRFGLSRADSVPNLTRKFESMLLESRSLSADLKAITGSITELQRVSPASARTHRISR